MKKTLIYGAATAAVVASLGGLSLSACRPGGNIETLYGPPPMEDPDKVDPQDIEALYGPPPGEDPIPIGEPDDIDEPIEDVYGPPVTDVELQPALYGPPVTD